MAAVNKGPNVRPVTPVGYEFNDKCVLAEDVERGDLLEATGDMDGGLAVYQKATAAGTDPQAIALMDGTAGQRGFDIGIQGEMDGFEDLTPGAALYLSGTVDGGLDDTPVEGHQIVVRAVTETRIRYSFV